MLQVRITAMTPVNDKDNTSARKLCSLIEVSKTVSDTEKRVREHKQGFQSQGINLT